LSIFCQQSKFDIILFTVPKNGLVFSYNVEKGMESTEKEFIMYVYSTQTATGMFHEEWCPYCICAWV